MGREPFCRFFRINRDAVAAVNRDVARFSYFRESAQAMDEYLVKLDLL